jgi:monoamine oxidase
VATFPPGVLKANAVRFEPALPPARQAAIDALAVTSVAKLMYGFDRPVFPPGCDSLMDFANPIPLWWAWDGTADRSRPDLEIVIGWAAGDVSRRLRSEAAVGEDILDLGLDALRRLVDQPDLEPVFATWHDWDNDPLTLGAYSSVPPGAERACQALSETDTGRLFWAGEATIPGQAKTVHGAIASGRRAANEVLRRVTPPPTS